ncbi:ATP-binding protein, partial [Pseudomonas aeruginosa]|nr:ATP-binding protein [Pseudomonas aeruginosa]
DRHITLSLKGAVEPVLADREMLSRAIGNLLSNAIRYTPREARIIVTLKQDDQGTVIRVENPGERISDADLPKLFDRFYRADPARQRKSAGAGLGLAIVKSIAEAHGGHVQATSNDTATKFDLTLPRIA